MKLSTRNIVFTALFITLGVVFPQAFHAVGLAGQIFSPMHIPVLICGFVCGLPYAVICGIVTPLLSSAITGMPPIFPVGLSMMAELAAYGLFSALLYKKFNVYVSLIGAMLLGRVVMGIANTLLIGLAGNPYSFQTFITAAFVTALPGIILHIIIVPIIVIALEKTNLSTNPKRA
ncbi:ECF transporter S component [Anaeropeptidivorans aminofermentans]|jgi:riboflavin transporter FmnP|uniref:ECF transporter S component n=1 Tax=Anaeropeptidivorans aminofermentans TaxID=2934315 RepID=UPI0020251346|nr:ECF transporter S component [Anaeropeptidivorans aminofermentans]MBE6013081.1 ECF transporter S component [Lachnospiraceae bacterium]